LTIKKDKIEQLDGQIDALLSEREILIEENKRLKKKVAQPMKGGG
ncbi:TPA: hypothetical protein M4W42_002979, partial [Enterococcus faecium]|jgi:hypothetical protein|nr:hypothetical protein [Enterococcus faecium]HAP7436625.1 hypothetical protein [Enterococcus faecium]HAR1171681.1 hypothetical protein [Enterococcus faecium]HBA1169558.1 hypothetical protein [Enterococcus faecium]HCC1633817.1 hypothetical protein [Enterococcus faecium]